ncbi:hypothetical protein LIER_14549 [Lithospermum erythrorhizon]|uniref:Transmembrane protein n=1 Tax=Lithospermum erythrorhizon TaxID=34254 RepID=A0AAV3Q0J1_LITER
MGTREASTWQSSSRPNYQAGPGLGPMSSLLENGEWTITKVLHDVTAVAGSGIGGLLSAIHAFNSGLPYIQKHVKGPKWLPFVVGVPPFLMYSAASAAFGGYALPKFTQLTVTSYYAASSASHYGVSLLTRHIEDAHTSRIQCQHLQ